LSALRAAERYVRRGFAVVPVPHGKKGPNLEGWEGLRLPPDQLPDHFNGKPQNMGLILGAASGGLVDVDLDAEEATRIAGRFLPPTVTSGRDSSPHSHWWYVSPGTETVRYKDVDGRVLVELRSTGCQTIVEPSVHPSGERVVWHRGGLELAEIEAEELSRRVRELATAVLIARNVPPTGGRHDFAMPLAGFLLRSGRLDEERVLKIVVAAWQAAGADTREAVRDLEGIVRDTAENLRVGEPVVGAPRSRIMRRGSSAFCASGGAGTATRSTPRRRRRRSPRRHSSW
jgi:Bifunctional DNA primase/polymerase, N-terminal